MAEPGAGTTKPGAPKPGAPGAAGALSVKVAGLADAITASPGTFAEHVAQAAATLGMVGALVATLPEGAERVEGQRVLDDLAATLRE